MQQLGDQGHMFDDTAFARVGLGIALLATIPGMPMIWMGQEFGAASEKCLNPRPLDWSLLEHERNASLRRYVAKLFGLRHRLPILQGDKFEVCFRDSGRRVFAFKRWNDDGQVALVLVNLKHESSGDLTLLGLEDGPWRERTYDYDFEVERGQAHRAACAQRG